MLLFRLKETGLSIFCLLYATALVILNEASSQFSNFILRIQVTKSIEH